ncbi:curli-like amyloid fiber formation chaperone CsgH [Hymenobacter sp. BRD67]|uniref:curli-like amyloid fiber formation chaperone CsgH n=1 Tax=Hymenobacter sp. BRD67 TaxID=2675877 RepID=UPI001566FEEB|nr:curli-like amyloid fiber formation chaperone CsgH [Hymenobacter sp. BRD67]QKG53948.1 hypothetical protein GKZ67_16750 [Hymenobacter sp. BRD67]
MHQQDGLLRISSHCRSLLGAPARYRYDLQTVRAGPTGQTRNTQRGSFELPPQQEITLSQVAISAGGQDHYHINLRIFDAAGRAVAHDSVSH